MALLAGTTITVGVGSAGGMREDLSDVIFDLFPEDTYCLSNFDREEASATYTEWMAQSLASPAANIQPEGDDATFASLTAPTRYGSYLQISSKTFLVSDTLEAVSKAGRASEVARGAIVKMRELKRDMEYTICGRQISSEGGAGTARTTARSTIDMAHHMGLKVVTEGVENQETYDLLEILDCDIVQGFLISMPHPLSTLEQWIPHQQRIAKRHKPLHASYYPR